MLAGATEPIGPMQLYSGDIRNRMREAVRENLPPRTMWWSLSRIESADINFRHGANQFSRGKASEGVGHHSEGIGSNFQKHTEGNA